MFFTLSVSVGFLVLLAVWIIEVIMIYSFSRDVKKLKEDVLKLKQKKYKMPIASINKYEKIYSPIDDKKSAENTGG